MMKPIAVMYLCYTILLLITRVQTVYSLSSVQYLQKGSAAKPTQKKTVAVLGGAGYLGALTYGFLQRSAQLYGTGIGGCRCIGATADTAVRLNRFLGMHFCLAFADESTLRLTDLSSVAAIQSRLKGIDALILGTEFVLRTRSVVPGTYEKTPNDKAWEVYWDEGAVTFTDDGPIDVKEEILSNVLEAAKLAGMRHLVVVDPDGAIRPKLEATGVPYTCICPGPSKQLTNTPSFTFKDGVRGTPMVSSSSSSSSVGTPVSREDLAALCVQTLQTLSWEESRTLYVSAAGSVATDTTATTKRIDQQWCVNSVVLEKALLA